MEYWWKNLSLIIRHFPSCDRLLHYSYLRGEIFWHGNVFSLAPTRALYVIMCHPPKHFGFFAYPNLLFFTQSNFFPFFSPSPTFCSFVKWYFFGDTFCYSRCYMGCTWQICGLFLIIFHIFFYIFDVILYFCGMFSAGVSSLRVIHHLLHMITLSLSLPPVPPSPS